MKYAYVILPTLIPVAMTASVSREVGHEEKLRDHLSMFRQVFFKSDKAKTKENEFTDFQVQSDKAIDLHNLENSENISNEYFISDEPNLTMEDDSESEVYDTYDGREPDPGSVDPIEIKDVDSENPDLDTITWVEPTSNTAGSLSDGENEVDKSVDDNMVIDPILEGNFTSKDSLINIDSGINSEVTNTESTGLESKESDGIEPEGIEPEGIEITDAKGLELTDSKESELTDSEGIEFTDTENLNSEKSELIEPQASKVHDTKSINGDSSDDDSSDEDEMDEDSRVSRALVGGLKELLGNQSNASSVFDFQRIMGELENKSSTNVYGSTPTMTTSEAFETVSNHTMSESVLNNQSSILSSVKSTISTTESLETKETQPKNADGASTKEDDALENLEKKDPPAETNAGADPRQGEKKANMKTVLDMSRTIRKGPPELLFKKIAKPKTYIEQPEPNSTIADSVKKTRFKDIQAGRKNDMGRINHESDTSNSKSSKTMGPHKKESLSDIRKMYFESLERADTEDMMSYFHRIYPELHHLLGGKNHDEHTETLIDKLSKALAKDSVSRTKSGSGSELKVNIKGGSHADTATDLDNTELESELKAELKLASELDMDIKVDEDIGEDIGKDIGEDIGEDVGEDIGEDVGEDVGEEVGDLDTNTAELKEWVEPLIDVEETEEPETSEYNLETESRIGFNNYNRKFRQHSEVVGETPLNGTKPIADHKSWIVKVAEAFRKATQVNPDHLFHHDADHDIRSEAPSSAELYPSVISAVVFVLFLILL